MSDAPEMLDAQPIKRYQGIDVDNEDGTVAWGCGLRTKEDGGPSIQLVDASAYDAALRDAQAQANIANTRASEIATLMRRITELEEQRRGFENAALDNETAAKKAKEQLAACRREFFEYRKVAWENEEIGHKALDDLQRAREAGRREGLEEGFQLLAQWGWCEGSARIRALIDSPKAEGEAAASRHGFHAACGTFHDLSICHVGAPAEAEGEETK